MENYKKISNNGVFGGRCKSDFYLIKILRNAIVQDFKRLNEKELNRIVDFGCGSMPYASFLSFYCREYIGCDLLGTGAAMEFKPGGILPIAEGSVDQVVSFQVLEHVHDVSWYLNEAKRILRPEGRILLSTHGTWPYHPHPEDYWRWTRSGIIRTMEGHGFEVENVASLAGPAAWTLMFQFGAITLLLSKFGVLGQLMAAAMNVVVNFFLPFVDRITPVDFKKNNASVYVISAKKSHVRAL